MYQVFNENAARIIRLLEENHAISGVYKHKKCYQDFRNYLESTQAAYSFVAGLLWLEQHREVWNHSKYKENRLAVYQLNDMFMTGTISSDYLYDNSPGYKRLPTWCRDPLDRYLERELLAFGTSYVNSKRISCAHFLDFLCAENVTNFSEITYHSIITYHHHSKHISQKCRDNYESIIRNFLEYLHYEVGIPLSLSYSLNKSILPYVTTWENLSGEIQERFVFAAATEKYALSLPDYIKKTESLVNIGFPQQKYSQTMIKTFRRVYQLLFIFLEMRHLRYSPELAKIWLDQNKQAFRKGWRSYRRGLCLFEQYLKIGAIAPETILVKHADPILEFPDWCRQPLEKYLRLRKKEGYAASTLAMVRSSCLRFLNFLMTQHISSYEALTPDLVAQFHVKDKHQTTDGKNAYNVRIRMFLHYLAEVELVADSLYLAIPCVTAPKTRVVRILADTEINAIKNYGVQSGNPMELRNRALSLLGLKMGLRASDIVNLKLTDISWQNRSLSIVQNKTGNSLTLPMPVSVANAIYRYVTQGRPESTSLFVFIHHRVPFKQLTRTACRRSLNVTLGNQAKQKGYGFHITRKTFASRLLQTGAPVNLIADSLGHQTDLTVSKYLALDEENMRLCAISLDSAGISLEGGVHL